MNFLFVNRMLLSCMLMLLSGFACCQYVGLTGAEKKALKQLINTDTSAYRIFQHIQKKADKALQENPNPIGNISTAGRLKGDSVREKTIKSTRDFDKIKNLALAYTVSGRKEYLDKALTYLKAWAATNQANGEPVNETKLETVLEGYDLIRNEISTGDRALIDGWLRKVADEEKDPLNRSLTKPNNNMHSHRLKIVGLIGFVINDKGYIEYAEEGLKQQIEKNLRPDGTSFDLEERDALHYHCYTLDPMLRLAIAFKRYSDKDYFRYVSPSGNSLKKSVDYLLPYISGDKEHKEYVNSSVDFDRQRSDNGQAEYKVGKAFSAEEGIHTLELAEYFDSSYTTYIHSHYKNSGKYPTLRTLLNAIK